MRFSGGFCSICLALSQSGFLFRSNGLPKIVTYPLIDRFHRHTRQSFLDYFGRPLGDGRADV